MGEKERASARKALADGDSVAALLYADRAVAAYGHAFVLARLARATRENDAAQGALTAAAQEARGLAASRQQVYADGDELEKQLAVARDAQPVIPSGATDPKREGARLVAARALTMEARLLCGSARLVSPDASGLAEGDKEVADLEAQIEAKPHPAPIDAAARVRAKCLERQTNAKRSSADSKPSGGGGDALLAELSASGGHDPVRDERGSSCPCATCSRGRLSPRRRKAKLADLGRVAAAHSPILGVQVVVHDAQHRRRRPRRRPTRPAPTRW